MTVRILTKRGRLVTVLGVCCAAALLSACAHHTAPPVAGPPAVEPPAVEPPVAETPVAAAPQAGDNTVANMAAQLDKFAAIIDLINQSEISPPRAAAADGAAAGITQAEREQLQKALTQINAGMEKIKNAGPDVRPEAKLMMLGSSVLSAQQQSLFAGILDIMFNDKPPRRAADNR